MVANREDSQQNTHKPEGNKLLTVTFYRIHSAPTKVTKDLTLFMHQGKKYGKRIWK